MAYTMWVVEYALPSAAQVWGKLDGHSLGTRGLTWALGNLRNTGYGMAIRPHNITTYETVYCWATVTTALGLPLSALLPLHWLAFVSQVLAVGLAILFPVGLITAFSRPRWCVPRIVVLCIVVSTVWIGVLLKYNSHRMFIIGWYVHNFAAGEARWTGA